MCATFSFAPPGLGLTLAADPWLAPWAAIFRRFAAAVGVLDGLLQPRPRGLCRLDTNSPRRARSKTVIQVTRLTKIVDEDSNREHRTEPNVAMPRSDAAHTTAPKGQKSTAHGARHGYRRETLLQPRKVAKETDPGGSRYKDQPALVDE
jgi:hypothetical protein